MLTFLNFFKGVYGRLALTTAAVLSGLSATGVPVIKGDSLHQLKKTDLTEYYWKFHPGNNTVWASPQFQDNNWQDVNPVFGSDNPLNAWNGSGWFRLWINVDSNLIDQPLALRINHEGASEIYVDGLLKATSGIIGNDARSTITAREPYQLIPVIFTRPGIHLVAVRYVNFKPVTPYFQGFQITLTSYIQAAAGVAQHHRLYGYMLMSVAVMTALGLLHLFLFLFFPRQKLNLYYSVFLLILVCGGLTVYIIDQTNNPRTRHTALLIHWAVNVLWIYAAWILMYSLNHPLRGSRRMLIYGIPTLFFLITIPLGGFLIIYYLYVAFFVLLMGDGLWQVFKAYKNGKPNVWLIGLGMLIVFLAYIFAGSNIFRNWSDDTHRILTMCLGILGLPFCYSLYLALDFAGTNKKLSAQALAREIEKRELLEAQAIILEKTVTEKTAQVQEQANQLREMDALKSRFFINITHEFRTPLTLILGSVQQLENRYNDTFLVQKTESIRRNSNQLLSLIGELLELGKLEAGKMKITEDPFDVVAFARLLLNSFNSLAGQKQISLQFSSNIDTFWIKADQQKLEKIMLNLVGNAVKFTDTGGLVTLDLQKREDGLLGITVTDNGRGISPSRLPFIFDRFYQADNSNTRSTEGAGIGLALTKELINLLGGSITVESREYEGTTVNILLPVSEIVPPEDISPELTLSAASTDMVLPPVVNPLEELPLILIIEDHQELLHFLRESLTGSFKTIGATDGAEGIRKAMTHIPDLIITDLMMPNVDGLSVCKTLKEDQRTSHIPVIMLTARVDTNSRVEGLQTGADAYITKPFRDTILLAQIRSLLLNRNMLRDKYNAGNGWKMQSAHLPSVEKEFLENARAIIAEHLDNDQFGVDLLAEKVGLSRTQLHRKFKALINQSPGDLIRTIRMEKAFELLKNNTGNVSEVSYMVGFGNPANFSTSFLRHFGFSPSEVGKDL